MAKNKIIYIPLEDLPQRYTQMMTNAIYPKVDITLYPKIEIDKQIKRGQFLDIVNTCKFKAAQLQMIAELFNEGKIKNGDAFLIGDIFFPGIEMIKYMAELQEIDVKVYGINFTEITSKDFSANALFYMYYGEYKTLTVENCHFKLYQLLAMT